MTIAHSAIAIAALLDLSGQANPPKYAEGQVWEYHARPQDAGSLIKIQQIDPLGGKAAYHISVIGVHFAIRGVAGTLPHVPVSQATLDASVTRLSTAQVDLPAASLQADIADWRSAKGGVFTIPLAQIIDAVDQQTTNAQRVTATQGTSAAAPM